MNGSKPPGTLSAPPCKEALRSVWIDSRRDDSSAALSSSWMKVSATEATDSARDENAAGNVVAGVAARWNVRWRDSNERPTEEVSGLGQGILAVTLPIDPS